jgi:hypothetical protein
MAVSLKFFLFCPNSKDDKKNFKLVSVQKWDNHVLWPVNLINWLNIQILIKNETQRSSLDINTAKLKINRI